MPIDRVRNARAASALARVLIEDKLPAQVGGRWRQIADGRGRISMVPIHSVIASRVAGGRWDKSWNSGWRFYWTHPELDEGALIEVARAKREARLGGYSWGSAAVRQVTALDRLTADLAEDPRSYRARILRLPWLAIEAIWLHAADGSDDRFTGLSPALDDAELTAEAERRARAPRDATRLTLSPKA